MDSPASFRGGWYDIFLQGTIDRFVGIQEHGGPRARGNQRLVIFPIAHDWTLELQPAYRQRVSPGVAYQRARSSMDYWLRGIDTGVLTEPPVRCYLRGEPADTQTANVWISCLLAALRAGRSSSRLREAQRRHVARGYPS